MSIFIILVSGSPILNNGLYSGLAVFESGDAAAWTLSTKEKYDLICPFFFKLSTYLSIERYDFWTSPSKDYQNTRQKTPVQSIIKAKRTKQMSAKEIQLRLRIDIEKYNIKTHKRIKITEEQVPGLINGGNAVFIYDGKPVKADKHIVKGLSLYEAPDDVKAISVENIFYIKDDSIDFSYEVLRQLNDATHSEEYGWDKDNLLAYDLFKNDISARTKSGVPVTLIIQKLSPFCPRSVYSTNIWNNERIHHINKQEDIDENPDKLCGIRVEKGNYVFEYRLTEAYLANEERAAFCPVYLTSYGQKKW